ncbi:hypothetical protein UO65_4366 [Actinokineospora spheciospongiae]|uniref:Ig-like domain-containing protein n=1 Tax=Actinokineospora spheciospongiae TaxID=909613 RepID=W7IJ23_9PSEU|nr:hypothetical protein [Actinokineospora spheciospongiae]EWC60258.1 hypothetical protein UO65_4366 [Actinokineospora spheciospongiae]
MGREKRFAGMLVATLAAGFSVLLGGSADAAGTTSLHGTQACWVPSGYTYSRVSWSTRCGTSQYATEFTLSDYTNLDISNSTVCWVPPNFAIARMTNTTACGTSQYVAEFTVLDPVRRNLTGVWSCNVPPGYTYSATTNTTNCSTNSLQTYFLLQKY